jgi:serine/threonine protein kinase
MAPEVRRGRQLYTPAVDIWSLGVVVYEVAAGLPSVRIHDDDREEWCAAIVDKLHEDIVQGQLSDRTIDVALLEFLDAHMVKLEPEHRASADACLRKALDLTAALARPTAVDHFPDGEEQRTIRANGIAVKAGTVSAEPTVTIKRQLSELSSRPTRPSKRANILSGTSTDEGTTEAPEFQDGVNHWRQQMWLGSSLAREIYGDPSSSGDPSSTAPRQGVEESSVVFNNEWICDSAPPPICRTPTRTDSDIAALLAA